MTRARKTWRMIAIAIILAVPSIGLLRVANAATTFVPPAGGGITIPPYTRSFVDTPESCTLSGCYGNASDLIEAVYAADWTTGKVLYRLYSAYRQPYDECTLNNNQYVKLLHSHNNYPMLVPKLEYAIATNQRIYLRFRKEATTTECVISYVVFFEDR